MRFYHKENPLLQTNKPIQIIFETILVFVKSPRWGVNRWWLI